MLVGIRSEFIVSRSAAISYCLMYYADCSMYACGCMGKCHTMYRMVSKYHVSLLLCLVAFWGFIPTSTGFLSETFLHLLLMFFFYILKKRVRSEGVCMVV